MTAATDQDVRWMQLAVQLASRGGPAVRPNPQVGCVLVRDNAVVGRGYHARCGGPHAEAAALADAGVAARGATAYVTLEPCDHHGRTPPCSHALIAAGVSRVVVGVADPNPTARGGCASLRAAGVDVQLGVHAQACHQVAEVFLVGQQRQRPYLQLKLAATLDGFIAATDGTSQWITGEAARVEVHRMRAEADAVLVGSGTALADDQRLDVRHVPCTNQPLRVVFDRRLRLPTTSNLAETRRSATLVVVEDPQLLETTRARSLMAQGVEVICVPEAPAIHGDRNDDPAARGAVGTGSAPGAPASWLALALRALGSRGVHHVFCEGGATLAAALLRSDLVDRLDLMLAPTLLGSGTSLWSDLGVRTLADAKRLRLDSPSLVGDDVWLVARRQYGAEAA